MREKEKHYVILGECIRGRLSGWPINALFFVGCCFSDNRDAGNQGMA